MVPLLPEMNTSESTPSLYRLDKSTASDSTCTSLVLGNSSPPSMRIPALTTVPGLLPLVLSSVLVKPAKGSRAIVIAASRARAASTNFLDFFISEYSFEKLYFFPSKLPSGMTEEKRFKRRKAADGIPPAASVVWERKFTL